jgi:Calcineurin-like phosphoesterase
VTATESPSTERESSRHEERFAGWHCSEPGAFRSLMPPGPRPKFSWLRPTILWSARNDPLVRFLGDPTDEQRKQWVAAQRERRGTDDLTIDRTDLGESFSCLIAGDTGEGTPPQFAVVPGLLKVGADTAFLVALSDVIYPIGDVNDYVDKFARPYGRYPGPIYAVPGNHDWYDGLGGYMRIFCGAEWPTGEDLPGRGLKAGLRDRFWRKPSVLAEDTLQRCLELRPAPGQEPTLPGPYWTMETGPVRFVGIDTGIVGNIDGEQGDWLREVSKGPKPKILLTGKPLVVNNAIDPGVVTGRDFTVDDVVRDPENNYVAAIGGDIHNYQRYPMPVDGRTIQYVVSGGGGAFMHATHTIPKVDVGGCSEDDFKCYPLRGDSLAFYSRLYSRKLAFRSRALQIVPEQASALIASRVNSTPTRGGTDQPLLRTRLRGSFVGLLPSGRTFHKYLSEFATWVDPPLFKHFLRLDVSPTEVRIRCFAATGCGAQELDPPVEDEFVIPLGGRA